MSERTDLKVGFACNNRCVFCAQGDKRSDVKAVPPEELLARMQAAFRPGRGLVLTGGEPTVHKHLLALVAAARRVGYAPIQVQTNARMLAYGPFLERLMEAGAAEISPALHGPTAEIHDALTRAPGSYEQTSAGIRNAVDAGLVVVTNTVVVQGNLDVLAATVRRLHELGVRHAQLALVHPVGTAWDLYDEVVPDLALAGAAIREAVLEGRGLGMRMVVEATPLCFLRGVEDASVEHLIPETTVVDLDGSPFAFSEWRRDDGKSKGPPCARCAKVEVCEGPWREFPDRRGWEGYEPFAPGEG